VPWQKQYNESELLDRAVAAFWARGYAATSISDLVEATGVNRGSLYAAYGDKRGLFLSALEHYDRAHRAEFLDEIARTHRPRAAILAAFCAGAAAAQAAGDRRGCLLVNTALELGPHDGEIERAVRARLEAVERFFRDRLAAARSEGAVPEGLDPAETARALFALFLGLRVITRSCPDPALTDAIMRHAEALLD